MFYSTPQPIHNGWFSMHAPKALKLPLNFYHFVKHKRNFGTLNEIKWKSFSPGGETKSKKKNQFKIMLISKENRENFHIAEEEKSHPVSYSKIFHPKAFRI